MAMKGSKWRGGARKIRRRRTPHATCRCVPAFGIRARRGLANHGLSLVHQHGSHAACLFFARHCTEQWWIGRIHGGGREAAYNSDHGGRDTDCLTNHRRR